MSKKTCCTGDCNQGRDCVLKSTPEKRGTLLRLKDLLLRAMGRDEQTMQEKAEHNAAVQRLAEANYAHMENWADASIDPGASQYVAAPQSSENSGEVATPRAPAHAAVTPMFLLNAAMCIESPHEVPTFRKLEVLTSLHRVADELQAERMAAMKGGAA